MNHNKPKWSPLNAPRDRDDEGTKRMSAVSRADFAKLTEQDTDLVKVEDLVPPEPAHPEPDTGLISGDELARLQQHARALSNPALDPLDQDLPVLSPLQKPEVSIPARLLPPPAPVEPSTQMLSEELLNRINMSDELHHGAKNALPVLASRLKPQISKAVSGGGYVPTPSSPQATTPPQPGQPEHDHMLRSTHIGLAELAKLVPSQETRLSRSQLFWMFAATLFGMILMALWLGKF
jgi:hypothetical protein